MKTFFWIFIVIVIGGVFFYIMTTDDVRFSTEVPEQAELVGDTNDEPIVTASTVFGIAGKWQSVDDEKSITIFKEDGTVTDVYDGAVMSLGVWEIFESNDSELPTLKTEIEGEEYLYTIVSVEETMLMLAYFPRGNTLTFKRLAE